MSASSGLSGKMRTLIVSPNWIGDAVMAQPLLQLLKKKHPDRPIDVLAPTWVAPVWRAVEEVDTVIESPFRHGKLQLGERWKLARALGKRTYADAYVLPNTLKFALIPWFAGIPQRVGYRGEMRYGLLNVVHRENSQASASMVAFYAALADSPSQGSLPSAIVPRPRLFVSDAYADEVLAHFGLSSEQKLIAFAPGSEFGSAKRWPEQHFARLAKEVIHHEKGAKVLLMGSPKDREVCDKIAGLLPEAVNLAGKTSLEHAIALISRADAVVSNDSGLLHVASGFNKPVIAIYGPTDPELAPPFSDMACSLSLRLECAPCRQRECPAGHQRCMTELHAGIVWEKLQSILAKP